MKPQTLKSGTDPGSIHRAEHPQVIHGRNPAAIQVADRDAVAQQYIVEAFAQIKRDIRAIAKMGQDITKPVDEYNAQEWIGATSPAVTLQPNWEYTEKIESIIITGPAAGVTSLQLGDRFWPVLTIPASGVVVIAPVGILLDRTDSRILTPTVPGIYSLELMGHADVRWST